MWFWKNEVSQTDEKVLLNYFVALLAIIFKGVFSFFPSYTSEIWYFFNFKVILININIPKQKITFRYLNWKRQILVNNIISIGNILYGFNIQKERKKN